MVNTLRTLRLKDGQKIIYYEDEKLFMLEVGFGQNVAIKEDEAVKVANWLLEKVEQNSAPSPGAEKQTEETDADG